MALALRWLIGYARMRPEKSMGEKLANVFLVNTPEGAIVILVDANPAIEALAGDPWTRRRKVEAAAEAERAALEKVRIEEERLKAEEARLAAERLATPLRVANLHLPPARAGLPSR